MSAVYCKSMIMNKPLDFYIKWTATCFVIAAVFFRSTGAPEYQIYDMVLSFIGCGLWFTVGVMWRDGAVFVLNGILTTVLGFGLFNQFFL